MKEDFKVVIIRNSDEKMLFEKRYKYGLSAYKFCMRYVELSHGEVRGRIYVNGILKYSYY